MPSSDKFDLYLKFLWFFYPPGCSVPAEQPCFPHLLAAPEETRMDWAVQLPAALEYRLMFA